jgi:cytochrome c oxidase subunit 3
MPAIITPPDIDRRSRRTEEYDGGNGRRPPNGGDLKRTGGGGDNEGWNDASGGRRRPGDRLATYRLGLFLVLGAVFMFFAGVVVVFFLSQSNSHLDSYNAYAEVWLPTAVPPILWLNTATLLLSSVTMEIARRRMFHQIDAMEEWFGLGRPTSFRTLPWLVATFLFGALFLAGQTIAWHQLKLQGITFSHSYSSSGHSFYIMTTFHAAHLTLGIIALLVAIVGLFRFRKIEARQIMVDCVGWYWHSMGILWGCLFVLLTCCQ